MADGDASINVIELKAVASTSPTLSPLNRRQLYEFYKVSEADHSMRVLDIDAIPQPFTSDIELSARLRVVSLDSSPRFAALSYVWGDYSVLAPDNLTIRLDDGRNAQIQITPNCREAIQTLGSKFGTITIWIDAVCINQEDVEEKASQILLMEDIYTRAEMVYVWLGADTEASRKTFRWLSLGAANLHFIDLVTLGKASTPSDKFSDSRTLLRNIVGNFCHRVWTRQLAFTYYWWTVLTFWKGHFFKSSLYQPVSCSKLIHLYQDLVGHFVALSG